MTNAERTRAWAKAHPARIKELRDKSRAKYPNKQKEYDRGRRPQARNNWLKRKYGITLTEFDSILESQGGKCALCLGEPKQKKPSPWVVDHCHKTSKRRAVLCQKCNRGLGHFNDDATLVEQAAAYLRSFE